jgi:putative redox protein
MATTKREAERVADATARIGTDRYHVDIQTGRHALAADEPAENGGAETGPAPFGLLLSGLSACTAITLRMYADRKGWPLEGVDVRLAYTVKDRATRWIDRQITLRGPPGGRPAGQAGRGRREDAGHQGGAGRHRDPHHHCARLISKNRSLV